MTHTYPGYKAKTTSQKEQKPSSIGFSDPPVENSPITALNGKKAAYHSLPV